MISQNKSIFWAAISIAPAPNRREFLPSKKSDNRYRFLVLHKTCRTLIHRTLSTCRHTRWESETAGWGWLSGRIEGCTIKINAEWRCFAAICPRRCVSRSIAATRISCFPRERTAGVWRHSPFSTAPRRAQQFANIGKTRFLPLAV